jgi:excisionase family DNA binding protein
MAPGANNPPEAPEWMTTHQVAEMLQVNDDTVRRYVREGLIPAIRLGRGLRFNRAQVNDALRAAAVQARHDDIDDEERQ